MEPDLNSMSAESRGSLVKPAVLRTYLTDPALSPAERVRLLSDATSGLAQAKAATLIRYLDKYRRTINEMGSQLTEWPAEASLPPSPSDLQFCRLCSGLYAHLASACARIVPADKSRLHASSALNARAAEGCYWTLYFLMEQLRCAYSTYVHAPPGIWRRMHQVYQYSRSVGIDTAGVRGEHTQASTVEHQYLRALLLGLCDPYNLSRDAMRMILDNLGEWAGLARLSTDNPRGGSCLFLVNPAADLPAMPVLPATKPSRESGEIYLDTAELVRVLREKLATALWPKAGTGPDTEALIDAMESAETVKQLIVRWGLRPIRNGSRTDSRGRGRMLTGLRAIAHSLDRMDLQVRPDDHEAERGVEILDEGENGMRIRANGAAPIRLRIGELIALSRDQEAEWSIGMVRWARTDPQGEFHIGFLRFSKDAIPVMVEPVHLKDERPKAAPVAGLWVVRSTGDKRAASLIVSDAFYKPGTAVSIRRGAARHLLEVRRSLMHNRCFRWFDVSLSESTPQYSLNAVGSNFGAPAR